VGTASVLKGDKKTYQMDPANVEEAHEWYRGQLLRYPAWRAFFDRHPDYRLF